MIPDQISIGLQCLEGLLVSLEGFSILTPMEIFLATITLVSALVPLMSVSFETISIVKHS